MDNQIAQQDTAPDDAPAQAGPRARQKARTRARILQCALEAFAEKGFEGASVREIAASAGVNHGLIRHHFKDKDRLWKAAVTFLFERLDEEMAPPNGRELTGLDGLKDWIRRYVRYCARHPEHARIMVQESIRDSARLQWAVDTHIRPSHKRMMPVTRHYIRKGVYPDADPIMLMYILVASAQMIFALGHEVRDTHGIEVDDPDFIDAHADTIVSLFFDHRADKSS
ncbi:MAG: TetR/AcrR family transcriptional regulator [Litorimonas sp.]